MAEGKLIKARLSILERRDVDKIVEFLKALPEKIGIGILIVEENKKAISFIFPKDSDGKVQTPVTALERKDWLWDLGKPSIRAIITGTAKDEKEEAEIKNKIEEIQRILRGKGWSFTLV